MDTKKIAEIIRAKTKGEWVTGGLVTEGLIDALADYFETCGEGACWLEDLKNLDGKPYQFQHLCNMHLAIGHFDRVEFLRIATRE